MDAAAFLQVANPLPEAMLVVEGGGRVVAANHAATGLFGVPVGRASGHDLSKYVAGTASGTLGDFLRRCARSRALVLGAVDVRRPDGAVQRCQARGAVLRPAGASGTALVLLRLQRRQEAIARFVALRDRVDALTREIGRRRRVEAALREQRQWLEVTLASIGDGVIATDPDRRIVLVNRVASALTGWSESDAIGRPLRDVFVLVHERGREPVDDPVARALREGRAVALANRSILVSRGGRRIPIDDSAAPIGESPVLGVVLVFRDASERRELERQLIRRAERLRDADRRKDELLAMLAHELRNPLAPIRTAVAVLDRPDASSGQRRWAAQVIDRQSRHMARLVDDLLDLSRITSGKIRLERRPTTLQAAIAPALDAARPLLAARRHAFEVTLPDEPLPLDADATRLAQIVGNLLDNAAKYTPEGGRVRLAAERAGDTVVLRVQDSGVGIPGDLLPSVFDLFTQGDRSLDRAQGGLGIGLTLVRLLVELHDGSVEARSEGPGRGADFVVRLPLGGTTAAPADDGLPVPAVAAAPRRVLVVDDNQDAADSLAIVLEMQGHEVVVANDAAAALRAAAVGPLDAALVDIGLPGMDGYELGALLRRERRGLLLVAVTGYGRDADRDRSRRAGFDHHLVKPVDVGRLSALLEHAHGT